MFENHENPLILDAAEKVDAMLVKWHAGEKDIHDMCALKIQIQKDVPADDTEGTHIGLLRVQSISNRHYPNETEGTLHDRFQRWS